MNKNAGKGIVIFIVFLLSLSWSHAHENDEVSRNAFERLKTVYTKEKEPISHFEDSLFDLFTYHIKSLFIKNKFRKAEKDGIPEIIIFLDQQIEDIERNVQNHNSKVVLLQLKDYAEFIEKFLILKNEEKSSKKIIEEKITRDIHVFNETFFGLDKNSQEKVIEIVENEMSFLVKNESIENLIRYTDFCIDLKSSLEFSCFQELFEETIKKSKKEISSLMGKFRNDVQEKVMTGPKCHFLNHELGFLLHERYGIEGIERCDSIYDQCAFGCYHGIAEDIHFQYYDLFRNKQALTHPYFEWVMSDYLDYEYFNLYHGFGHAFIANVENISGTLELCSYMSNGNENRKKYCLYGAAHELFIITRYENKDLVEASKECDFFGSGRDSCYQIMSLVYANGGFEKALDGCKILKEKECFTGLGTYLDNWLAKTNVSRTFELCEKFMSDQLPSCYKGIIGSSVFYLNNVTRTFTSCNLLPKGKKEICFTVLKEVHPDTYFSHLPICEAIDPQYKEMCLSESTLN